MAVTDPKNQSITTTSGIPIADDQNSITAGARGPVLLQDFYLIEKLQHFSRERIPERVAHAKGSGAYGTFTVTKDITKYTKAKLFSEIGKKTDTFVRFSTVGGARGSADSARDPRGFSIRFYTEQGNWDIVGLNMPVFFIKDAIKFADFVHTQKPDPYSNVTTAEAMFDFWSHAPESLHQLTMLFTNRGTPYGYRFMPGYGLHAFSMINEANEVIYIKWHFLTQQGIKNLTSDEATKMAGEDADYAQKDLHNSIEKGDFPKWTMCIQVATIPQLEAWEAKTGWNPFDVTKIWSHEDFPLEEVGVLELNKNPANYFAEVEQAAFALSNTVAGIGFSPDKLLQGRLFAYHDAQLHRVGTNHQHIPVNAPRCPFNNNQRDGSMTMQQDGSKNYGTVVATGLPTNLTDQAAIGVPYTGLAGHYDGRGKEDDYTQVTDLFNLLTASDKNDLFTNLSGPLSQVKPDTLARQLALFDLVDPAYGEGVRAALRTKGVNV